jgi:hypothetical protein
MNVSSSVSWVSPIIKYLKDNIEVTVLLTSIAVLISLWAIRVQKQSRNLQKNPSELAGVQLEKILEAKLKTTLEVTYRRGENRIGIFTIQNTGSSDARDIKLKIDTPRSQFAYVNYREFLTKDGTFELPDLNPGQYHSVFINWDSSDSRADVSWSWVNADASSASEQHTFDRWS